MARKNLMIRTQMIRKMIRVENSPEMAPKDIVDMVLVVVASNGPVDQVVEKDCILRTAGLVLTATGKEEYYDVISALNPVMWGGNVHYWTLKIWILRIFMKLSKSEVPVKDASKEKELITKIIVVTSSPTRRMAETSRL